MTLFDGLQTATEPMALVVDGQQIEAIQPESLLDAQALTNAQECGRAGVMTPGLIDCHTHLVFGGQRADEFEMRLEGASYTEIAKAGGGIISTVTATRAASEDELFERTAPRLQALMDDGVTTVEIKSGYGLTVADELKMLRVARRLGEHFPVHVVTSLLGAHAVPPEYSGDSDGYIDLVCNEIIPAAAAEGLADAVDVFCETIAFSVAQCERVFEAAAAHGLPIKAHAEQLSNLGGAAAAARHGALSADHIEYLDTDGVAALKQAGSSAVLLPGAFHMLRETQTPPVAALRQAGVPMALATDANPGSSPLFMPTLMLNLGCTLFRLTPQEALAGMTGHAATALGRSGQGRLAAGAPADLCIWDVETPAELAYAVQPNRLRQRVIAGEITHG
jgi:imidazolonepropionase